MTENYQVLLEHLEFLYGKEHADPIFQKLVEMLDQFVVTYPELTVLNPDGKLSEKDVILITYGDMVSRKGEAPLKTLGDFLKETLAEYVSTIHILPFYPYSSDDGFSVIDYRKVNPDFGDWSQIAELDQDFRLMFDAVVNHCSSESAMFQGFLKGDSQFAEYFTVVEPGTNLTKVFRPRATPVVTPYQTSEGEKLVWTTFSADQVDLNFQNPEVLLEIIRILLFYIKHGAEFIRFDAVTYVWKELGTNCINLPQTHRFVQLMRSIVDLVAPNVVIITETNVPHKDNIAYFGDGANEAQMVYNFALPLLTLHSFLSSDVQTLSKWASTLSLHSDETAFFNFLACHDGIGMLPVKDILSESEIGKIVEGVREVGGFVSYKSNEDGTQSPYELNINYLDAISAMDELNINYLDAIAVMDEVVLNAEQLAKRFLASQAIMLALRGVPGIYFHSIFGSRNWIEGVERTGRHRTINREKLDVEELKDQLSDPKSLRSLVFQGYLTLLKARQANPAFHPFGKQEILELHPRVFSLIRTSPDARQRMLCLHHVGGEELKLEVDTRAMGIEQNTAFTNILTGQTVGSVEGLLKLEIQAFDVLWLSF